MNVKRPNACSSCSSKQETPVSLPDSPAVAGTARNSTCPLQHAASLCRIEAKVSPKLCYSSVHIASRPRSAISHFASSHAAKVVTVALPIASTNATRIASQASRQSTFAGTSSAARAASSADSADPNSSRYSTACTFELRGPPTVSTTINCRYSICRRTPKLLQLHLHIRASKLHRGCPASCTRFCFKPQLHSALTRSHQLGRSCLRLCANAPFAVLLITNCRPSSRPIEVSRR